MTLHEKIDDLRKKNGMTWSFLNQAIGAYRGKLTELKHEKTTLDDNELSILAEKLRTSKNYLLGLTDDQSPDGEQKEKPPAEPKALNGSMKVLWDEAQDMTDQETAMIVDFIKTIKKNRRSGL